MAGAKDEIDIKFGLCAGLGLTVEQTVDLCGVASRSTYYDRTAKHPATFEKWRSFAAKLKQLAIAPAVEKLENKASAQDQMHAMFLRALAVSEKRLARVEALGDDATDDDLKTIHKDFTKWAIKYSVSEAPKRLEVGGEVVHTHQIADETVQALTAFNTKYGLLPPADVAEAEIVD